MHERLTSARVARYGRKVRRSGVLRMRTATGLPPTLKFTSNAAYCARRCWLVGTPRVKHALPRPRNPLRGARRWIARGAVERTRSMNLDSGNPTEKFVRCTFADQTAGGWVSVLD